MPVFSTLAASLTIATLFLLFGCEATPSTAPASARTVNVADLGIVPGKDVSAQVNQLLDTLRDEAGVTLYFPKGTYVFKPEHAVKKYRAVTNHDNSIKAMAFPLYGFKDFTLDGGGSTFLFHGRISPLVLEGTDGVTLKNFTIDWDTPFHHELTVVESDPDTNSFVAEIHPMTHGFEVKGDTLLLGHDGWQDEIGQNTPVDPDTLTPVWDHRRYQLNRRRAKAEKVGETRVRLTNATREAPPVGTVLNTYGNHPTNRLAQAIHAANAKDTVIRDVTVHAAGGMGVIAERCENVHLERFVVTAAEGRFYSARADATHFLGCKGLIKLKDCVLEHMGDDGINVHGAYVKVNERRGEQAFICEISHVQQVGLTFAGPGDRVMITSRETLEPLYETTVTGVEVLDEATFVLTVADAPVKPGPLMDGLLSVENLTWNPDLEMRNCVVRKNRARSVLVSTNGRVLIEDNVFSSQMHGILIEGDNNKWYESGGVRNVTIRNNVFDNPGYGAQGSYPLFAAPLLTEDQRIGDTQYHRDIRFVGNTVRSFNGHLAHGFNVQGLVLEDNVIEHSNTYPTGKQTAAVALDFCHDASVTGNRWIGFDEPMAIEVSDNSADVRVSGNAGLSE